MVRNGQLLMLTVRSHANKVYLSVNCSRIYGGKKKKKHLTWISRVNSLGALGSNTRLDLRVPDWSRVKNFPSFPDTMRNSKGGPFLGESLSLTDSCARVVPAAWFS